MSQRLEVIGTESILVAPSWCKCLVWQYKRKLQTDMDQRTILVTQRKFAHSRIRFGPTFQGSDQPSHSSLVFGSQTFYLYFTVKTLCFSKHGFPSKPALRNKQRHFHPGEKEHFLLEFLEWKLLFNLDQNVARAFLITSCVHLLVHRHE